MGQYHYIVNLDKGEYLHPHKLGDGLKLLEFGSSGNGTMCALAILLAKDNGRGGGDLRSNDPIVGRWAGDRIVIAGDYGDDEHMLPEGWKKLWNCEAEELRPSPCLYEYAGRCMLDISAVVREVMCEDSYLKSALAKTNFGPSSEELAAEAVQVRLALNKKDAEQRRAAQPSIPDEKRPQDPFEIPRD